MDPLGENMQPNNSPIYYNKLELVTLRYSIFYRKVASSRLSWLVAHSGIFRLFSKGKFDAHALSPLVKEFKLEWQTSNYTLSRIQIYDTLLFANLRVYLLVTQWPTTTGKHCKIGKKWSDIYRNSDGFSFSKNLPVNKKKKALHLD